MTRRCIGIGGSHGSSNGVVNLCAKVSVVGGRGHVRGSRLPNSFSINSEAPKKSTLEQDAGWTLEQVRMVVRQHRT